MGNPCSFQPVTVASRPGSDEGGKEGDGKGAKEEEGAGVIAAELAGTIFPDEEMIQPGGTPVEDV